MRWPPWRHQKVDATDALVAKIRAEEKLRNTKEMTERIERATSELQAKLRRNEFSAMIDTALRGRR